MIQQYTDLIEKVWQKIKKTTRNDHHIVLQVQTHINLLQSTGKGQEVLEHYLANETWYLGRVFYYEGKVYDFNNLKIIKYSKANRHSQWNKVLTFSTGKINKTYCKLTKTYR